MTLAASKSFPLVTSTKTGDLQVTRRGSHSLVYKSVPATSHKTNFELYVERFTTTALNSPRITMSGTEEFAKKFKSRPNTRTPVVRPEVKVKVDGSRTGKRGTEGFFPSIKVRGSGNSTARTLVQRSATSLEIAPSTEATDNYYRTSTTVQHDSRRTVPVGRRQAISDCSRQCSYVVHPYPNLVPDVDDIPPIGGDLSYLPRPLKLAPRRELPFVYRHKIKRNMNVLFKIMASQRNGTEGGAPDSSAPHP